MSEDPHSTVVVTIEAPGWSTSLADGVGLCRAAGEAALAAFDAAGGEVSIVLADDDFVRALNRNYRGRDRPTNVLSFPQGDPAGVDGVGGPRLLGDVIVALETVKREAAAQGKSVADHLAHLVVHGTAHLLGFDHRTDADADAMERREIRALATLGIADPYRSSPDTQAAGMAAATS